MWQANGAIRQLFRPGDKAVAQHHGLCTKLDAAVQRHHVNQQSYSEANLLQDEVFEGADELATELGAAFHQVLLLQLLIQHLQQLSRQGRSCCCNHHICVQCKTSQQAWCIQCMPSVYLPLCQLPSHRGSCCCNYHICIQLGSTHQARCITLCNLTCQARLDQ